MKATRLAIPDVILIEPKVFGDNRGFFMETYHQEKFREMGIEKPFVQDNHSKSSKGVLRGLHYQLVHPQGKLVRTIRGEILDVAVDVRKGSPTFGKWVSALLTEENKHQLYVPEGFAHGFLVLSESAEVIYKCTDLYAPQHEYGIRWNDPAIGIDWPISDVQLSEKDKLNPMLADQANLPLYQG